MFHFFSSPLPYQKQKYIITILYSIQNRMTSLKCILLSFSLYITLRFPFPRICDKIELTFEKTPKQEKKHEYL